MTKTCCALEFTIDRMGRTLYLWTFTFREVKAMATACKLWGRAAKDLSRKLGFSGVRVFELHPGGHGLHIHVVTPFYYPVVLVRVLTTRWGFGRIHVKPIKYNKRHYVTKYLQKQQRAVCLKGRRLWATVGGFKGCLVKNIRVESTLGKWARRIKGAGIVADQGGQGSGSRKGWLTCALAYWASWDEIVGGEVYAAERLRLGITQGCLANV